MVCIGGTATAAIVILCTLRLLGAIGQLSPVNQDFDGSAEKGFYIDLFCTIHCVHCFRYPGSISAEVSDAVYAVIQIIFRQFLSIKSVYASLRLREFRGYQHKAAILVGVDVTGFAFDLHAELYRVAWLYCCSLGLIIVQYRG